MKGSATLPACLCRAVALGAVLALGAGRGAEAQPIPAFPGAEGYGMWTVGGRGGDVRLVTTLMDYAEDEPPVTGSLRAAVEAEGPRTIVFRISGTIDLVRPLEIHHGHLTIAGQSAPGEGVALSGYGLDIWAQEVIVRYLRVRPGDLAGREQDALNIRNGPAIIDHCSVSWATDETLSIVQQATEVTVQHCLIAESLNESVHHKGNHGYGSLLTASGNVSIHHSIYAFHESRSPRPKDVRLDFRRNLVYGWGDQPGYVYDDFLEMNYVSNLLEPLSYSRNGACGFNVGGTNARIFARDNRFSGETTPAADEGLCAARGVAPSEITSRVRVEVPFPAPAIRSDGSDLKALLLAEVGATRPARDTVDRRILGLIEQGQGRLIDSQEDVGGWPQLASGEPPEDLDRDGMPDVWERRHGLNPEDGTDHRADADGDGYTNLEEYLNGTDPGERFAWTPPPAFSPAPGTAFLDSLLVSIESGAIPVHVTTDGSEPDGSSTRYAGPIWLKETTHLRARALLSGGETTTAVALYPRLAWQPATEVKGPLQAGLRATTYVADDWDEGPPPERLEPVTSEVVQDVNAVLAREAPGTAVLLDGWVRVPTDGLYTFWYADHPRSRLLINGVPVSPGMPSGARPAQLALRAGLHRVQVRSLHEEPPRRPSLTWSGPGVERQPLAPDLLFHANE